MPAEAAQDVAYSTLEWSLYPPLPAECREILDQETVAGLCSPQERSSCNGAQVFLSRKTNTMVVLRRMKDGFVLWVAGQGSPILLEVHGDCQQEEMQLLFLTFQLEFQESVRRNRSLVSGLLSYHEPPLERN